MKALVSSLCLFVFSVSSHAQPQAQQPANPAIALQDLVIQKNLEVEIAKFPRVLQSAIPRMSFAADGGKVDIQGFKAQLRLQLDRPKRIPGAQRDWSLRTTRLAGRVSAQRLLVRGIECRNVVLALPESGGASLHARLRYADGKISVAGYRGIWPEDSWEVESTECTGSRIVQHFLKKELRRAMSPEENQPSWIDAEIRKALQIAVAQWNR